MNPFWCEAKEIDPISTSIEACSLTNALFFFCINLYPVHQHRLGERCTACWEAYIIAANSYIQDDIKLVKDIDFTLRLQEDWEQFKIHFDQVHGDFLSRLRHEFHDLSPNDQKLSAFLRLNLDTKEIANLMGISTRGIEVARYRLRKKLGLGKGENLSKFMLDY